MPQSPLSEADPTSIDELFSRLANNQIKNMPREILGPSLSERVKALRAQRSQFLIDLANNVKIKKEKKINLKNLTIDAEI